MAFQMGALLRVMIGGALLGILPAGAEAVEFPTTTVRIIEPYAPGGGADLMTRVLAQKMSEIWGQSVVVENHPGAGATIGAALVAKAAPDGYTLLMSAASLAVAPSVYKNLTYNVTRDFTPVTLLNYTPVVLAVNPSVPAKTVAELIAYAKANPGKLNVASAGTGTLLQLTSRVFQQRAGIQTTEVAYRGSEPALIDLIAGQVDVTFDTPAAILPYLKQGKLRVLAVTTKDRFKLMPDVPTLSESGMPDFDIAIWNALLLPAGVPAPIVDRVNAAARKAMSEPDVVKRMEAMGYEPLTDTPEQFSKYLGNDVTKWAEAAHAAGITPE